MKLDSSNTFISVLEGRHADVIRSFKSASAEQNDFLSADALEYARLNLGVTYLLFNKSTGKLLAFLTLGMGAIKIPKNWSFRGKMLHEYPKDFPNSFPALKVGQLATQSDEEGNGAGTLLIEFSMHLAIQVQKKMGCAYVIADAKLDKIGWYERRGFKRIVLDLSGRETIPMYLEL